MKPILEQIPLGEHQSILAFEYKNEHFDAPWHFHPQHELTLITQSFGTKFIGDYVGPYEPGELVLLRSHLPHCWKNYKRQHKLAKSIVIQWNKGIFPRIPELSELFVMLKNASHGILFSKTDVASLRPYLEKTLILQGNALYIALLELLSKLSSLKYILLSEASFEDDMPSEHESRMSKIHDFVEKNYSRKISLREMAFVVNMSEQSFSRFFSKVMGRSFFAFLNEYRINIASRMLIDTDWSVAQIGFECGYESLPFYYKQFKKVCGITPNMYRKAHTKIH